MREGYPSRSVRLAWRVVGGEAVVADPAGNRVHVLNRTATAVWGLIDGTRRPARIALDLAERMECDASRIEGDMGSLLDRLDAEGLIEWSGEAAAAPAYGAPAPAPVGEYVPPEITCTEALEVVAAVCSSTRTGQGNPPGPGGGGPPGKPPGKCRVLGACQTPFE